MDYIEGIFTKRANPVSFAIRCATPVSITTPAPASHVITVDGNTGYGIEANMMHGVRRLPLEELLEGAHVVTRVCYSVPDAEAGLAWGRQAAQAGIPYDWPGALGLGLAPDRNWQEPDKYFCFELHATILLMAGRKLFVNNARISAQMLLGVWPGLPQIGMLEPLLLDKVFAANEAQRN